VVDEAAPNCDFWAVPVRQSASIGTRQDRRKKRNADREAGEDVIEAKRPGDEDRMILKFKAYPNTGLARVIRFLLR
jgi:hypothetical protein